MSSQVQWQHCLWGRRPWNQSWLLFGNLTLDKNHHIYFQIYTVCTMHTLQNCLSLCGHCFKSDRHFELRIPMVYYLYKVFWPRSVSQVSKHCNALIFDVDILELYYITYLFLNCLYLGLLVTTVQCSGMCVSAREHVSAHLFFAWRLQLSC